MLTSDQTKSKIILLIVLNSIVIASLCGCIVVMIIGNYYGFMQSSPIPTCADIYFKLKFNEQNIFLSASFVGSIFSLACSIIFLIDLIICRTKFDKIEANQINKMTYNSIVHFYILVSLCLIGCWIPLGYIASILIQAKNKCGTSIGFNQLIIAGTAALAEILFVVCWILIIKLSHQLDENEQGEKQDEKQLKVEQKQVLKNQQAVKELSIIKEMSMIKEQDKSVGKDNTKQMEGQILKQEDGKIPLLNKSIYENQQTGKQKSFMEVLKQSDITNTKVSYENPVSKPFLQVEQPMERPRILKQINKVQQTNKIPNQRVKEQKFPSSQSYPFQIQKQPQIKINKEVPSISDKFYSKESEPHKVQKAQKIDVQIKPSPSQNTTHVTINFPTMQPNAFLPQTPTNKKQSTNIQEIYSQPSENKTVKHPSKSKKRQQQQVIKESVEEEQSLDSDDYYYKREKKGKKRNFNLDREQQRKSNKKGRKYQQSPNYQRQFQRLPSRFQPTPSQPRYILLSPQSVRTFQDFLKEQKSNKKKNNRNFSKFQDQQPEIKKTSQVPLILINEIKPEDRRQDNHQLMDVNNQIKVQIMPEINNQGVIKNQGIQGNKLLKNNQYYQSEVKQVKKNGQKVRSKKSKLKQLDNRQKSIVQKLNMDDSAEQQLKKYKQFFKPNRQAQKQETAQPSSSLQQYFNLLNSRVGNVNDNSYNSLSNYSSILNEQNKGKIPSQRDHNTHKKINLQKSKIQSHRKSKQNLMQKIRHKYH